MAEADKVVSQGVVRFGETGVQLERRAVVLHRHVRGAEQLMAGPEILVDLRRKIGRELDQRTV